MSLITLFDQSTDPSIALIYSNSAMARRLGSLVKTETGGHLSSASPNFVQGTLAINTANKPKTPKEERKKSATTDRVVASHPLRAIRLRKARGDSTAVAAAAVELKQTSIHHRRRATKAKQPPNEKSTPKQPNCWDHALLQSGWGNGWDGLGLAG
jgi:hypothetical protein